MSKDVASDNNLLMPENTDKLSSAFNSPYLNKSTKVQDNAPMQAKDLKTVEDDSASALDSLENDQIDLDVTDRNSYTKGIRKHSSTIEDVDEP